jgi:quercetin dioxygenase-like cupin family protein
MPKEEGGMPIDARVARGPPVVVPRANWPVGGANPPGGSPPERTCSVSSRFLAVAVLLAGLGLVTLAPAPAGAQDGQPLDLPCTSGVTVYPLGQGMPTDASGQALVLLRLTIAPGGGFEAHTHPGTLVVTVESGTLDLTQLSDVEMSVVRAATGATPAASEPMTKGTPLTLNPGDWFVEPKGVVHNAFDHGSDRTVVLLTGLVDPTLPFVQCYQGTPSA